MPDETGWLIEKGQLCLGSCDRKPRWVTFTDPTAVRFARNIDAENMLNSLRSMSDKGAFESCTINDHMWCSPVAAPSREERLETALRDLLTEAEWIIEHPQVVELREIIREDLGKAAKSARVALLPEERTK